jgi:hypothetical protein
MTSAYVPEDPSQPAPGVREWWGRVAFVVVVGSVLVTLLMG